MSGGSGIHPDKLQQSGSEHFHDGAALPHDTGLSFFYFPQGNGESLLKVITMTRVREAEKLLKEGASVVEAGEKVGFRDSSTFIRTFKKYTGVTPGQVKGTK